VASAADWIAGARPRTLPAAVAPVAVGTGVAAFDHGASLVRAALALGVALALQVGVNFANDYSDGVRGTDDARVGPMRLTASGTAPAARVRRAAFASFAVAAMLGLVLVALVGAWWLLLVGAAAIVSAWFYTGGPRPYGYAGLGELFVFVFFGLVAVMGTAYVQLEVITGLSFVAALPIGFLATALLVVNNLRDIPSDEHAGKHTLAVRLGAGRTRGFYLGLILVAFALGLVIALVWTEWAFLTMIAAVFAVPPAGVVLGGATGPALIPALRDTGRTQLAFGLLLGLALAVG
jgi:1,4-dihydroxy-2-naphthoate octaprenyltransferase